MGSLGTACVWSIYVYCLLKISLFVATEICRLRWNWFYLILVSPLVYISYTSTLSSFHQFVTNPTAPQLNVTEEENKVMRHAVGV